MAPSRKKNLSKIRDLVEQCWDGEYPARLNLRTVSSQMPWSASHTICLSLMSDMVNHTRHILDNCYPIQRLGCDFVTKNEELTRSASRGIWGKNRSSSSDMIIVEKPFLWTINAWLDTNSISRWWSYEFIFWFDFEKLGLQPKWSVLLQSFRSIPLLLSEKAFQSFMKWWKYTTLKVFSI